MSSITNIKMSSYVKDALVAGSLRGMDSSGIAVITEDSDISYYKQPINGTTFIQDRRAASIIESVNKPRTIAMTHTRHATVGKVSYNNAHPFHATVEDNEGYTVRELIGCHNGTITGIVGNQFGTDSEWAINRILAEGKEAFKHFAGAYAFSWWDSDDEEHLNLATNGQRDVYIGKLTNGGLLYASEAGMLNWLAERNSLNIEGAILQLQPHKLYRFNVKNPCRYEKEELPKAVEKPVVHYSSNYNPNYRPYETHFDKVKKIFDAAPSVAVPEKKELTPLVNSTPAATAQEIHDAKEMDLFGVKGVFDPIYYDVENDEYQGLFKCVLTAGGQETEWDAVIAGYGGGATLPDSIKWPVSIHGLRDDGTNLTLCCSKPALVAGVQNAAVN